MKTIIRLYTLCTFALLSGLLSYAQNEDHENVKTAILDYFVQDREYIHLHLPKDVFNTGEKIWFKGYVLNTKSNLPSIYTSNVYITLHDSKGNEISKNLIFANSGSFSGNISLNKSMSSGRYYLRVYTNFMNNFREDMSTTYPITLINPNEKRHLSESSTDISSAQIDIRAEGGSLLAGSSNNIGVHITDCLGRPYQLTEAELLNNKNEVIKKIPLNKFGYGKFQLNPDTYETYKIVVALNGQTHEAPLPAAQTRGLAVEINNYAIPNKTIVKLRTSAEQAKTFSDKPLMMIIQQGATARFFELTFNTALPELELTLSNDQLYDGTNTFRFINAQSEQLAERIVFKYPETYKADIRTGILTQRSDKFIKGMAAPNAYLSASVLPEYTNGLPASSITGSFLLNPHIKKEIFETSYYFVQPSKQKHYELDLALINQESKYKWTDIMLGQPAVTHDFDYGLLLKGKVNQTLKDRGKYRVRLFSSHAHLLLLTEINDKNEFEFKNLVIADSAKVSLSLVKLPDLQTPVTGSISASIVNGDRKYLHPLAWNTTSCTPEFIDGLPDDDFPAIHGNMVLLNAVEIENKAGQLTRQHHVGNSLLRGYKIEAQNNGQTIMNFLNQNGFDAGQERGEIYIYGRSRTTINGQRSSPVIFLDNFRLMALDELWGLQMADIDEVYLNAHAIVPGINNNIGVVRIYRKSNFAKPLSTVQDKTTLLTILHGYNRIRPFNNADYILNAQVGYGKYGLIHWIPLIITGEDGLFLEKLPEVQTSTIKVHIEGMTPEGKFISEVKEMVIKEQ
jgi:hypothetical protein